VLAMRRKPVNERRVIHSPLQTKRHKKKDGHLLGEISKLTDFSLLRRGAGGVRAAAQLGGVDTFAAEGRGEGTF